MKKTVFRGAAAVLAAATALTAAPVMADPAEDAIQARRGYYRMIAMNFGPLVGMVKGEKDYSAEEAALFATNLDLLAKVDIRVVFPEGTDNEAMAGKTRALKKAWADQDGVMEKDDAFEAAAAKLAEAAPTGLDALRPAVGALGETCKGCHDAYRAKDF